LKPLNLQNHPEQADNGIRRKRTPLKYLPNVLTLGRIALTYVFISVFFSEYDSYYRSLAVLTLAGITDIADGFIARRFDYVTDFGKLADPFADKFLQCSVLVCMCIVGLLPIWLMVVFALKESLLIAASILLYGHAGTVVSSNIFGKTATAGFYITIIASLVFPRVCRANRIVFMPLYVAVTLMSLLAFTAYYFRYRKNLADI